MKHLLLTILLTMTTLSVPIMAQDQHSGIDPDGFDTSVRPQDDLFMHVNGRWRHGQFGDAGPLGGGLC